RGARGALEPQRPLAAGERHAHGRRRLGDRVAIAHLLAGDGGQPWTDRAHGPSPSPAGPEPGGRAKSEAGPAGRSAPSAAHDCATTSPESGSPWRTATRTSRRRRRESSPAIASDCETSHAALSG